MMRARREMNGGRTQLGFVGTGVHRRLAGTGMNDLPEDAFSGGVDFSHRWGNDAWLATGYALGSSVRGDAAAILALQEAPARYYQRPDADYVHLDSAARALGGWGGGYTLARVKGHWQGGVLGVVRSPGFELNDVGYLRNADQVENAVYFQYRQFDPVGPFRRFNVNFNGWDGRDFGWERTMQGFNFNGSANLKNYWGFYAGVEHNLQTLATGALRGGPAILKPATTNGWSGIYSDDRKRLNGELDFNWGRESESGGWSWSTSLYANWRPTPSSRISLSPSYSRDHNGWQYVAAPNDAGGDTHYLFGVLDQQTVGVSARVSQTFSPTLSLQVYAQPFIAAGTFAGFRQVSDPRAAHFDQRFQPLTPAVDGEGGYSADGVSWSNPDFDYRAINLNAVLRWEYRSGSTVYFAWSHSRDGSGDDGHFRLWHDTGALFGYHPTNVFLVKVNWWVSL